MTIMFALVLSIDALSVGVAYKLKNISLPILSKLIICLMSFISTLTAMLAGKFFSSVITDITANVTGSVLLILTGIFIIKCSVTEKPEKCDINNSKRLEPKEAVYMGIILSFDSFCSGIGLGFINISPVYFSLLTSIFQFIFLYAGEYTTSKILKYNFIKEKTCEIISGLLLIIVAIFKLF